MFFFVALKCTDPGTARFVSLHAGSARRLFYIPRVLGAGARRSPHANLTTSPFGDRISLLDRVVRNVELGLRCERVHGDLSAYNILYEEGRPIVIDFPQAVDPRSSPDAYALHQRDVFNVCRWFRRKGLRVDAGRLADRLWTDYLHGEL